MPTTLSQENPDADSYSFGPYEVWVQERALLRDGKPVKIQRLPFRLLIVFLENPGRVLTYEELRESLWGAEASAVVDNSLWTAVARLRKALGDDAAEPLFIQAIAREGYRFISKRNALKGGGASVDEPPIDAHVTAEPEPPLSVPLIADHEANLPLLAASRRKWWWVSLAFAVAVIAFAIAVFILRSSHPPLLSDQDRTIWGGITNHTSQQNLNDTLSAGVRVKLEESPFINLVPDGLLQEQVKNPDSAALTTELAACVSLGAQALIRGEVTPVSSGLSLVLRTWSCSSGKLLDTERVRTNSANSLFQAVDQVTFRMRRALGESGQSAGKFNAPLAQITTDSIPALDSYNVGREEYYAGNVENAIAAFKLAIELDSRFASAYAALGTIYLNEMDLQESHKYYEKAYALRERTMDRERLSIGSHYAIANGDIPRAIEEFKLWRSLYPKDHVPANGLAVAYMEIGQPDKGIASARAALELAPTYAANYLTLARLYLYSGAYSNLNTICGDHDMDKYHNVVFHLICYLGDFAQSNASGMQQELQWAQQSPDRILAISGAADTALYRGKIKEAKGIFAHIREAAETNHAYETRKSVDMDEAVAMADFDLSALAKDAMTDALHIDTNDPLVRACAALVLARAGDVTAANSAIQKASTDTTGDLMLQNAALPSAQAMLLLHQKDINGAIKKLESVRPFDFYIDMDLAPAYYRGLAYLRANRLADAKNEFQSVLDHRNLSPASPYLPLSEMELGHACQLSGDSACTAKAYSSVEAIWKDADRDFPPLKRLIAYEHPRPKAASL